MTSYKLTTITVTSLSTQKYTKKISSSRKQEPAQQTPCYAHNIRKTVTRRKVLTPIMGPQCTTINNNTTVPTTKRTNNSKIEMHYRSNDHYGFVPD